MDLYRRIEFIIIEFLYFLQQTYRNIEKNFLLVIFLYKIVNNSDVCNFKFPRYLNFLPKISHQNNIIVIYTYIFLQSVLQYLWNLLNNRLYFTCRLFYLLFYELLLRLTVDSLWFRFSFRFGLADRL